MLSKTRGIVLHHFSYSNSSVIAKIFTEEFGKQSYVIRGIKGKTKKKNLGVLQPLTQVELTVRHKQEKSLHNLAEISIDVPYHDIPFNIHKSGIAIFYAELLLHALPPEEANKRLFAFVVQSCNLLDSSSKSAHFLLLAMVELSKHLGFYPTMPKEGNYEYFDMREGVFVQQQPLHPEYMKGQQLVALQAILGTNFDGVEGLQMEHALRQQMLTRLMQYYQLHIEDMRVIKSHRVLMEVFGT